MINALLALCVLAAGEATTRVIPRFDGVIFEIVSGEPMSDSVSVRGYKVDVRPGVGIAVPDSYLPYWVYGWELHPDSCGFTVEVTHAVDSLEYSISSDGRTMLLFFRAAEPLLFPELSWKGPPEEPEYLEHGFNLADSAMMAVLESGRESPWLDDFDCVVIDPGHGGRDPGAIGFSGSYEKDRTLEIALLVRDILNIQRPDLEVVMTRTTDRYMSLGERTRLANSRKADLFISIHCNAATSSSAHGFETFFLSRARTDDGRAVEMLENSVIELDEGYDPQTAGYLDSPLAFLLADMAQNIYLERSSALAVEIQKSLETCFPGNASRGVKQAGFYVLRGALMPSVLVELAFISNPDEERLLQSLDFRLASAEAIVDAVLSFMEHQ